MFTDGCKSNSLEILIFWGFTVCLKRFTKCVVAYTDVIKKIAYKPTSHGTQELPGKARTELSCKMHVLRIPFRLSHTKLHAVFVKFTKMIREPYCPQACYFIPWTHISISSFHRIDQQISSRALR